MLDNDDDDDDDGALTDTDTEDGDSDDDDEDTETNFVNISDNEAGTNINSSDTNEEQTTNDEEIIRTVDHNNPIRRAKLSNLEEAMNADNYDRLPPQRKQTFLWKAKDKRKHKDYKWDTVYNTEGRLAREQIIPNRPGPSRKARNAKSIAKLFGKFITNEMINNITDLTNANIQLFTEQNPTWNDPDKYSYVKPTTSEEIRALFGLMFIRGVMKQNLRNIHKIYFHKSSNPIYKATMGINRFKFLVRCIQFDDFTTRPQRRKSDRFAAFREFFRCFNENCTQLRTPSEYLAIDETLYPYRGKIVIFNSQYNPNKPAKYGILYRSISDGHVPCTYYTLPYAGKPEEITDGSEYVTGTDNYTKYLVEGLKQHVNLQGRNISMDRYFNCRTIFEYLLDKGLTVVGTMRSDSGYSKRNEGNKIPRKPKHRLCI